VPLACPPFDLPILLLDAASPRLCAGLRSAAGREFAWRETDDEAGVGLFRTMEDLLRTAGVTMGDVRTVVFCDGPGSLLGIRLTAMALRTWMALPRAQPLRVLAYRSLALVAADLLAGGEVAPFHVCSDARRETWNVLTVSPDGVIGDVRRCGKAELPDDGRPLFFPESFPHWQPLPAGARAVPYRPRSLPELAMRFPLLQETNAPDAFMTEMPTYRTWSPTP
jgi:tRNA threonylcarbamoyladenosine biosynthesis protein TsaB